MLKKHVKELEDRSRELLPPGSDPAKIANYLISNPVTNIQEFSNETGCARDTGKKYLDILLKNGILTNRKIGRNSFYGDMKTLEILKS
jgi:predicted transcriptional regulator